MKHLMNVLLIFLCAGVSAGVGTAFSTPAFAQQLNKLPRVAELEDNLRSQSADYLRSRFPEQPFLINVSVDPVRRNLENPVASDQRDSEALPYFDTTDSKIQDEWDDPNLSTHQLLLRTKKVSVEVFLSENVSDGERSEVKDALFQSLHLLPARDEIKVETRKWTSSRSYTYYFIFALASILTFLIGFSVIQRFGYQRLAQALSQIQPAKNTGAGSGAQSVAPQMGNAAQGGNGSDSKETTFKGGVEVSDPVLARKIMVGLIDSAKGLPSFPTLMTMVHLDRYGEKSPAGLGALLHELPGELQKTIFSLSNGSYWLKAMLEPGTFGMEQLNFFQKLIREAMQAETEGLDLMLIHVWRLGADADAFLRSLKRDQAFAILAHFPKDLAIPLARKAFPGAWADLIDPDFASVKLSELDRKQIQTGALKVRPLTDLGKLAHYRKESEILEYLKFASIEDEREIYLASKPDSGIHHSRPPFYVIFESSEELLRDFVPQFNPHQWSLVLWDVNAVDRKKIEDFMFDKQRFMFKERLTQLERNPPEKTQVSQQRERMARGFADVLRFKSEGSAGAVEKDSEELDEKKMAA